MGVFFYLTNTSNNHQNEACKKIGYEESTSAGGVSACQDSEGNRFYVEIECEHSGLGPCTAKPITVGYVEVSP